MSLIDRTNILFFLNKIKLSEIKISISQSGRNLLIYDNWVLKNMVVLRSAYLFCSHMRDLGLEKALGWRMIVSYS